MGCTFFVGLMFCESDVLCMLGVLSQMFFVGLMFCGLNVAGTRSQKSIQTYLTIH